MKKRDIIAIVIAIMLILIDQLIKNYMLNMSETNVVLINGFLKINVVENTGIAFSIADKKLLSIIVTNIFIIIMLIKFTITQKENLNIPTYISIVLIIAGGVSNLIDRCVRAAVIDFIDVSDLVKNFPVFNIADILIVIGFIIFAIFTWFKMMDYRRLSIGGKTIDTENKSK